MVKIEARVQAPCPRSESDQQGRYSRSLIEIALAEEFFHRPSPPRGIDVFVCHTRIGSKQYLSIRIVLSQFTRTSLPLT
jgi:hypothetical protein